MSTSLRILYQTFALLSPRWEGRRVIRMDITFPCHNEVRQQKCATDLDERTGVGTIITKETIKLSSCNWSVWFQNWRALGQFGWETQSLDRVLAYANITEQMETRVARSKLRKRENISSLKSGQNSLKLWPYLWHDCDVILEGKVIDDDVIAVPLVEELDVGHRGLGGGSYSNGRRHGFIIGPIGHADCKKHKGW